MGIVVALSEEGLLLYVEERWVHYGTVPLKKQNEEREMTVNELH